jgi:hypothetical protein
MRSISRSRFMSIDIQRLDVLSLQQPVDQPKLALHLALKARTEVWRKSFLHYHLLDFAGKVSYTTLI